MILILTLTPRLQSSSTPKSAACRHFKCGYYIYNFERLYLSHNYPRQPVERRPETAPRPAPIEFLPTTTVGRSLVADRLLPLHTPSTPSGSSSSTSGPSTPASQVSTSSSRSVIASGSSSGSTRGIRRAREDSADDSPLQIARRRRLNAAVGSPVRSLPITRQTPTNTDSIEATPFQKLLRMDGHDSLDGLYMWELIDLLSECQRCGLIKTKNTFRFHVCPGVPARHRPDAPVPIETIDKNVQSLLYTILVSTIASN
ncbi:hypothetical protein CC2G_005294 [Coprinopsis cinerea AmutBmut pab1-1]|nr:hypothetical protein CC2G_005294 [Coprinopsis cinerea AmutBmut pab1-1]